MEGPQPCNIGHLVAGADLRTKQFYFVTLDSAGKVILVAGAGGKAIGVLQNKPNTDEPAEICPIGVTKVVCSASIAAGASIMSAASGKAVTAGTAGSTILGYMTDKTGAADGQIGSAFVNCGTGTF